MPVIEAQGLTRVFRTRKTRPGVRGAVRGLFRSETETLTAVDRVSFSVEGGELVGFLGPNGAGKTTTLKMLSGLLHPTTGSARVLGFVPWERQDAFRRQFALLLGQKNQLWWDLPARESLELNARIYGIAREDFRRTVDELTALLSVGDKLGVMVRELSLGERMKLELIAALLHQPRVLFLDEPTIGLDVVSQQIVREFLRDYNARRATTILLTSHYLADIQALCRRVIIIDHGRRFFDGPLQEILDRFVDYKVVTVHTDAAVPLAVERLHALGEVVESAPGLVRLRVKRDRVVAACKRLLDEFPVQDLDIEEVPVEDVIRQLFARQSGAPKPSDQAGSPRPG
jgi:ABC-2 type transport system ATP-binding protein